MTSNRCIKRLFENVKQNRGLLPQEVQLSKKGINVLNTFADDLIKKIFDLSIDELIEHNKNHKYKPKKRITLGIIQNCIVSNLTLNQIKMGTSGQQKPTE